MADIEKVIKGLESCNSRNDCKQCPYAKEYDPKLDCIDKTRADAIELLKELKNLIDGLIEDQLKKDEEQQTEIERLNDTLRIMYNRCICFCGSQNCSECKQKEECESKRSFWHGYYLFHGERVKKDGEKE